MDYAAHVAALERESAALVAALRATSLDAPVPSCPDWTARGLAEHVGASTGFWLDVVLDGIGEPKAGGTPIPDDDALVADWVAGQLTALSDRLRSLPADAPCWSWREGDENVGFVARRWANETAIHRIDAQLAAGRPEPVDADLAVDGIEEMLGMADALRLRRGTEAAADSLSEVLTLHLHAHDRADDGDGEWLVAMGPDGCRVERTHAKGDFAMQGTASDLELKLYQRPTLDQVTTFGDPAVLDRWYQLFTF